MEKICLFHGIEVKAVDGNIVFICNGDSGKIIHILQRMDKNISKEVLDYMLSGMNERRRANMEERVCICDYLLEKGKMLYVPTDWQGGIAFDEIKNIRFCPCCGKELKTWQEES